MHWLLEYLIFTLITLFFFAFFLDTYLDKIKMLVSTAFGRENTSPPIALAHALVVDGPNKGKEAWACVAEPFSQHPVFHCCCGHVHTVQDKGKKFKCLCGMTYATDVSKPTVRFNVSSKQQD